MADDKQFQIAVKILSKLTHEQLLKIKHGEEDWYNLLLRRCLKGV